MSEEKDEHSSPWCVTFVQRTHPAEERGGVSALCFSWVRNFTQCDTNFSEQSCQNKFIREHDSAKFNSRLDSKFIASVSEPYLCFRTCYSSLPLQWSSNGCAWIRCCYGNQRSHGNRCNNAKIRTRQKLAQFVWSKCTVYSNMPHRQTQHFLLFSARYMFWPKPIVIRPDSQQLEMKAKCYYLWHLNYSKMTIKF
jgi:hypothetical protein